MKRFGIALLAATVLLLPIAAIAQTDEAPGQALQQEAADLKARIEAADRAADEAEKALSVATVAEKEAKQAAYDEAAQKVKSLEKQLDAKIGEMNAGNIDAATYKAFLVERGILTSNTASGDAILKAGSKWAAKAKNWVTEKGPGVAISALVFLIILLVFRTLGKIFGGVTHKALSRSKLKVSTLLREFFTGIVRKGFLVLGLIIALQYVGIDMGPVLAGIGVVGFVIGFALQDTLGNFASGIMILLYRPYDVGSVISTSAATGKVEAMSLVSTTILTPDNQVIVVPNNSIWGGTITNINARSTRRVDMTVGVSYSDDLDKTAEVLMDVVKAHPKVLENPEPVVKVANLGDSSVDFVVRPWSKTADYWDVMFDLNKMIKQRLDAEGISIPFPQRDVNLYQQNVSAVSDT